MEYVNARWMYGLHGFLYGIAWIMFHGHLECFQIWPLGGKPNTKPGDHGTSNAHNCWFILFYHVWGPTWIEIHWNSIWSRAWSHMTSNYTWGSMTTQMQMDSHAIQVFQIRTWPGLGGMGIVIKRWFLVGTRLLTSLCSIALLLRSQYMAHMMRLIDLELMRIYRRIFMYYIRFSRGPFLRLFWQWKGIELNIE